MDCTAVRDAILEAEPAELRRLTDSDVSVHLRQCSTCRALAMQISKAEDELRGHFSQAPQLESVAAALEAASVRAGIIRRRRRRGWAAVPALAAAGVAVALLVRTGGAPPANVRSPIPPSATAAPLVETTAGPHVAVLETDNPNIVVVWTF
jgi:hypothetical protein